MEKILKKNSLWNKIFCKSKLREQSKAYRSAKILHAYYSTAVGRINNAKDLNELLECHKDVWRYGYRNTNLSPNPYGMFRTSSIEKMTIDQVYLGDIWGLWTNNIRFWNIHKDDTMAGNGFGIDPNKKVYDLIMDQYKYHLLSNINVINSNALTYVIAYEKLNGVEKFPIN
jgi:hypothetical protein